MNNIIETHKIIDKFDTIENLLFWSNSTVDEQLNKIDEILNEIQTVSQCVNMEQGLNTKIIWVKSDLNEWQVLNCLYLRVYTSLLAYLFKQIFSEQLNEKVLDYTVEACFTIKILNLLNNEVTSLNITNMTVLSLADILTIDLDYFNIKKKFISAGVYNGLHDENPVQCQIGLQFKKIKNITTIN